NAPKQRKADVSICLQEKQTRHSTETWAQPVPLLLSASVSRVKASSHEVFISSTWDGDECLFYSTAVMNEEGDSSRTPSAGPAQASTQEKPPSAASQ
ncbi:hypothetical protein P7K49_005597, partial [Saguinus oedipus]